MTAIEIALEALRLVGLPVAREALKRWRWRQQHPCEMAVYHAAMIEAGGWVAWHRWRWRRQRARCLAFGNDLARCDALASSASNLARRLALGDPLDGELLGAEASCGQRLVRTQGDDDDGAT